MSHHEHRGDVVDEQTALVTGAARGIGLATAAELSRQGRRVVIADVDHGAAVEAARRLADDALMVEAVEMDVSSTDSVRRGLADANIDRLHVLVSNAGVVGPQSSETLEDADWERVIQINLGGGIRVARETHPLLLAAGRSSIVLISSVTAHRGFPARLAYSASKAALEAMARVLALEWASHGIRVNAVAPGFILTEQSRELMARGFADAGERARRTALGRLGSPQEVAQTIAWLSSDAASYVTGQTIVVDGGYLADGRTGPDSAVPTEAVSDMGSEPRPSRTGRRP